MSGEVVFVTIKGGVKSLEGQSENSARVGIWSCQAAPHGPYGNFCQAFYR